MNCAFSGGGIILDNNVLPTLLQFYGLNHSYFQDDNATCHVSSTMY
ncbi:hypothetical protein TNCT_185841, partial [Trichonephila clavata]